MKKLGKLKLNDWAEAQLSNSELRQLKGGSTGYYGCSVGCAKSEQASREELEDDYAMHTPVSPMPPIPPSPIPVSTPPLDIVPIVTLPRTT